MNEKVIDHRRYMKAMAYRDDCIFVGMFLLFPLFVVISLIHAVNSSPLNYRKSKNYRRLAWQIVIIFIVILVFKAGNEVEISPTFQFLVNNYGLYFLIPFIVLLTISVYEHKRFLDLKAHYKKMVLEDGIADINEIARITGHSPLVVKCDLQCMIDSSSLDGVYIDGNSLIFDNDEEGCDCGEDEYCDYCADEGCECGEDEHCEYCAGEEDCELEKSVAEKVQLPKDMECHGCGARIRINPHQTKECDYCGSIAHYT